MQKLFVLVAITVTSVFAFAFAYEHCLTPDNKNGLCVPLKSCDNLQKRLNLPFVIQEDIDFAKRSQCGLEGNEPKVCCENSSQQTSSHVNSYLLPEPGKCGFDYSIGRKIQNRIAGGTPTGIKEYPWTALLQYRLSTGYFHSCGGVLINERYIITAAHCLEKSDLKPPLVAVRLGEWNLSSPIDCDANGVCNEAPIDLPIEEEIVHENYDPGIHILYDIAMLRLKRAVTDSDFIKPICLPIDSKLKTSSLDDKQLYAAGWGKIDYFEWSEIKLVVPLDGVDLKRCQESYPDKKMGSGQICAGGVIGKDTCNGDSGSPLMAIHSNNEGQLYWFLAGIVSFGAIPCGTKDAPGVYTRVSEYMDWILDNMRP